MRSAYDVSIIGAGPVGTVAAIAYAQKGARVLLAEANPDAASRLAGEWLHPPGTAVLERLGLLPIESALAHRRGSGFVVFPDDGEAPIRLPYPDGALGMSFDHRQFVEALRERAESLDNVDYLPGQRVVGIEDQRIAIVDRERRTREVATDFVVGAEGRRSISREHLGLSDRATPLSYMAGVEMHGLQLPFEGYGHVFLGGPGPILMYPIGPGRVRACLDIPLGRCPRRRDTALLWRLFHPVLPDELVPAFREALHADRVQWTAIRFRPRSRWGAGNVALAGDAVGYVHPLTAVGMTLGLDDAWIMADSVDVEEYRRRRERSSYVAELLSNALYHLLSREDVSIDSMRTAVYRMWGENEHERTRTMRILITEDHRSASFAAAFLKVAAGAFKHLLLGASLADGWRRFPAIAAALGGHGRLLQWPAAALIPNLIRALVPSPGASGTPISRLHRITAPPIETPPPSTPLPCELGARVGLASAFGAISDALETLPEVGNSGGRPDGLRPRLIETLSKTRWHLEAMPRVTALLRQQQHRVATRLSQVTNSDADRPAHAPLLLAVLDRPLDAEDAVRLATLEVLACQSREGSFGSSGDERRTFGRRSGRETGVETTAVCCRALAAVRRHHPRLLADHVRLALGRAANWIVERQEPAGSWPGPAGRPSVSETAAGIEALVATGSRPTTRALRRASRWLGTRQDAMGCWEQAGTSPWALTSRVVAALIAMRSPEVSTIERGVNALPEPTAWSVVHDLPTLELCWIAEGLAAFLEWSRDVPAVRPAAPRHIVAHGQLAAVTAPGRLEP